MLYRLFVILALVGAWFAYKEIGAPELDPIGFVDRQVSEAASTARVVQRGRAPAQCGPYFLYVHPESGASRFDHRKVYTVSRTPPDDRAAEAVLQVWAYGVATHVIAPHRQYRERATFERDSIRPATFNEVRFHRIGDNVCRPYRPNSLECDGRSPFCQSFE